MPWAQLRRLALEAGIFPPLVQPVSEAELAELLARIRSVAESGSLPAWEDRAERANLAGASELYAGRGANPDTGPARRISSRLTIGFSGLGDPVPAEAGLAFAPGWSAAWEPSLDWSCSGAWFAAAPRWRGRLLAGGVDFAGEAGSRDALTWPGWTIPTGKSQVRSARLADGAWNLDLPYAMAGVSWGHWALSAGRSPRSTGAGVGGSLGLDAGGTTFPAVTVRRTNPFHWRGPIGPLAPEDLLLRVGLLSEREGRYRNEWGLQSWSTHPWFFQWLLGWEVTSWFRLSAEHTAMAATEEGTLWWDLPQINFPIEGTTWREVDSGPVTDRIFNLQMEFRWTGAPWPVLPRDAGRLYWQYGGTDFQPSGPGGLIPEISAPASVAGFELFSPRWDLGLEYTELEHELILWYSNGGFPEGYSQDGWLLGHSLGGSGEQVAADVRFRPRGRPLEFEFRLAQSTWGMAGSTPGTGDQTSVGLTLRRTLQRTLQRTARGSNSHGAGRLFLWEWSVEWQREKADPAAFGDSASAPTAARRDWWRILCRLPIR